MNLKYLFMFIMSVLFYTNSFGLGDRDSVYEAMCTGFLEVNVQPIDALVFINNESYDNNSVTQLDTGKYLFTVKKKNFYTKMGKLNISLGDTTELKVKLIKMSDKNIVYTLAITAIMLSFFLLILLIKKDKSSEF